MHVIDGLTGSANDSHMIVEEVLFYDRMGIMMRGMEVPILRNLSLPSLLPPFGVGQRTHLLYVLYI